MVTSEKTVRRGPVVFIGNSQDLDRVRTWVEGLGLLCLDEPVPEAELVVADELILDGICTPREGVLLATAREWGLLCLPPTAALGYFGELVHSRARMDSTL